MLDSAMNNSSSPVIAFFDVDNTLVKGACLYYLGVAAFRSGLIGFSDLVRFAARQLSFMLHGENREHMKEVRVRALALLDGNTVVRLEELSKVTVQKKIQKRLIQSSFDRLLDHLQQGHHVWLATAAPEPLALELGRMLKTHGTISTKLHAVDGVYTGSIEGQVTHHIVKAEAVRTVIEEYGAVADSCWAYSDSFNDLPLLEFVGNPVAVNPDRKLNKHASALGWEILPA